MSKPAARISDMHVCPMVTVLVPHVGGPILPPGCPTVLIGGLPAACLGDLLTCVGPPDSIVMGSATVLIGAMPAATATSMCVCVGPPDVIALGSFTVMIGGKPAARMGDMTAHGGSIVLGCFTVLIGG